MSTAADRASLPPLDTMLRRLTEHIHDEAIFVADDGGRILTWSPAATALTGLAENEAVGQSIAALYVPEDIEAGKVARDLAEARRKGQLRGQRWSPRRPDTRYLADIALCHLPEGGYGVILREAAPPPAEDPRMEAVQRINALGLLTSAIAHDFNNLLLVVAQSCEQLITESSLTPEQREEIERIALATDHAASLTSQLLAVSGGRRERPATVIDLNAAVAQTARLLQRTFGPGIVVEMQLSPRPAFVHMHEGDVGQILINLALNARDAMSGRGVFRIATSLVTLDADAGRAYCLPPGVYSRLDVADTGGGMSEETCARAFEPFFTTKDAGRGTGLGLASVQHTVKEHGGRIDVHSEPGRGTTFTILLPVDSEAPQRQAARLPDTKWQARPGEAVLVVDDEPVVREIVAAILRNFGYETVEAGTAADALHALADRRHQPSLIVTDLVMPDLSGPELARRLREACPDTKILFMSGYSDDTPLKPVLDGTRAAFLQKPFTSRMLGQKVRELLDAPTPGQSPA